MLITNFHAYGAKLCNGKHTFFMFTAMNLICHTKLVIQLYQNTLLSLRPYVVNANKQQVVCISPNMGQLTPYAGPSFICEDVRCSALLYTQQRMKCCHDLSNRKDFCIFAAVLEPRMLAHDRHPQ